PVAARQELARWFTEEVHPHESRLRAWLISRFPKLTDLDDVIQEAYFRLFRAKDFGGIKQTKAYLFSTARNVVLDRYKHEKIIPIESLTGMDDSVVLVDSPDAAESTSHEEELALLAEAIRGLPERCREVLVLKKLHGLSQKEIALRLGISAHTVAAH